MKMDWFKYTRHVLVWLVSTLFFFTIISADYVDVQVATLVACLFAPFLFEPSSIKPKTKWTIDLAIIAVSVCAILLPVFLLFFLHKLIELLSPTPKLPIY